MFLVVFFGFLLISKKIFKIASFSVGITKKYKNPEKTIQKNNKALIPLRFNNKKSGNLNTHLYPFYLGIKRGG